MCHFIETLCDGPFASLINFVWNVNECQILFIIWSSKMGFCRLQNEHYFNKNALLIGTMSMTLRVCAKVLFITRVIIQFL